MPSLPAPSELVNCQDLGSCFQNLYNLLFAIFVAMAFLYFLFGAFEYLLSGAGIYEKEKGKSKMKNSVIALIVVLVIPVILNMINPNIFKAKLQIPKVTVITPELYLGEDHDVPPPPGPPKEGIVSLGSLSLDCITVRNMAQASETIVPQIQELGKKLCGKSPRSFAEITSGFSHKHQSPCHTKYGTCIDIKPFGIITEKFCPKWKELGEDLESVGARITYETKAKSIVKSCEVVSDSCGLEWKQCPRTTGAHIHAEF